MASERSIESAFVRLARQRGWEALKLAGPVGWPDRSVLLPKGKIVFLEFKTSTGRVSAPQKRWLGRLTELGHNAYVVRSAQEAVEICEAITKRRTRK